MQGLNWGNRMEKSHSAGNDLKEAKSSKMLAVAIKGMEVER